jgi:hypothetical protein
MVGIWVAVSLVLGSPAAAQADGAWPSPDGRATVVIANGEALLTVEGRVRSLGRMPLGPPAMPGPDAVWIGGRFERAFWAEDSRRVAIVGRCTGYSGVSVPPVPRCSRDFVRIVDLNTPDRARWLAIPWPPVADMMQVRQVAFERGGDRIAVVAAERWSDCSYEGDEILLYVWDLRDGSRRMVRQIGTQAPRAQRVVTFEPGGVRVTSSAGSRVVALPARE